MNIEQVSPLTRKDYIYAGYISLVPGFKEYDSISRKKMFQAMVAEIEKGTNILTWFSYDEFLVIKNYLKNGRFTAKDIKVVSSMNSTPIITYDKEYVIIDEFKEALLTVIDLFDVAFLKRNKELFSEIPMIIKAYGIINTANLKWALDQYYPGANAYELLENVSYFRRFYSPVMYAYEDLLFDTRHEYYYDELLSIYNNSKFYNQYLIPMDTVRSIGKYNLDLTKSSNKKLYSLIKKTNKYDLYNLTKAVSLFAHFNLDLQETTEYTEIWTSMNIAKEMYLALSDMPSAYFGGRTKNESLSMAAPIVQENAHLSESDSDLFYSLYFALLEYTNNKYRINPRVKKIYKQVNLNPQELYPIRMYLSENKGIIDDFIKANPFNLNIFNLDIISKFRHLKKSVFILMEHGTDYTYALESDAVYALTGVRCNISEIIPDSELPCPLQTIILPFKGKIIYDGLFSVIPLQMQPNFMRLLNEEYGTAKQHIVYQLDQLSS